MTVKVKIYKKRKFILTALSKKVKKIKGWGLYSLYINKTVTLKLLLVQSYMHLSYINRFMYAQN